MKKYSVVPFGANIQIDQGVSDVANQLSEVINKNAAQGWRYIGIDSIETIISDPGSKGSL